MKTEFRIPFPVFGESAEPLAKDIFDVEEIQRIQDLFSDATGVASIITHPDGTPITKPSNFCRLCNDIIRKTEKGCSNCFRSDAVIGTHNLIGPTLQPCLSGGLWDAGASITIGNKHIANWLIGQIRNEDIDENKLISYADEIGANKDEFIEAMREVPVMSTEKFKKIANMLFVYANDLSERIYKEQQLKRKIAELERTYDLLQKSEESLAITLYSIGDGVITTDNRGLITNMNPVAEHLCGWELSDALSLPLVQVFNIVNSETRIGVDNPVNKVLETGKIIGLANHTVLISKTGIEYHIADSAAPIRNKQGQVTGVVLVFSDVTEKYQTEADLRASEHFLKQTQIIGHLGTYLLDVKSGNWTSSDVLDSIFGIQQDFDKSVSGWVSIIHPEWKQVMNDYMVDYVIGGKNKFDKKYKIIRQSDMVERWVHGLGELVYNAAGEPIKMIGTVQDITERKNAAIALRESEELYRSILNASPDAIIIVELDGIISMVSLATLSLYGCADKDELIGKSMFDFVAPVDKQRAYQNVSLMPNGNMGTIIYQIRRADESLFFAEVNGDIIRNQNGQPTRMILVIRDITNRTLAENALKNSQEQLKSFASHLQTVREEERILLAREIHDELGQSLIAIKIDLGMMKQKTLKIIKNKDTENILTIFDNLFSLVDNTIKTTKKIMTDLRPEVLYLVGFTEAVKIQVNKFQERHRINCYYDCSIPDLELNMQKSVALFRILQESLTNVVKHANATSVTILLFSENDKLILEIGDNGVGMDLNQRHKPDSFGLIGMKERMFILDGELKISSQPGKGTKIRIEMPFSEKDNQAT
ncbi:PAS/PAC sensor signal transduction histidine kinase [Paludibacter propionicigenes WB4]|uniref:PAS/PAC sensor signal transduction histidine kinase n=1 Tax=Paludibacter propionicigenes (strain DSM 17365 / JCM 13257 / WB4) TaxID=694427 RepID=E4T6G4_PALPW|nr:PocR ligand-binding domain-containing protein [Paludibacter propionicigenes]ADQ80308.1 PAS/PAC sensor signal transduction histidine kinase [Paludibacter propionicigenes WB4]